MLVQTILPLSVSVLLVVFQDGQSLLCRWRVSLNMPHTARNNLTLANHPKAVWNVVCIIEIFIRVTVPCLTIPVLVLLIREKKLHVLLNIHTVILLNLTDYLWFALANPFGIINNFHSNWILSGTFCNYVQSITGTGQPFAEVLISANRFWAASFVIHTHRRIQFVLPFCCVSGWIFSVMINALGVRLDVLYYRLPLENKASHINSDSHIRGLGFLWFPG